MRGVLNFFARDSVRLISGSLLFIAALICSALSVPIAPPVLFILTVIASGHRVIASALRGIFRRDVFDEKLLMTVGAVGAMIIGEWMEGAAVMLFFTVGEFLEGLAVKRSRRSIRELMNIRPDEVTVIKDGVEQTVDADDVEVGDAIVIRAGERVGVDCTVTGGGASVDTSSITGESLPRYVALGERLESGFAVLDGVIYATADKTAQNSSAARILELVENASENKSREEYFITKFARYYTPAVVVLALLVALVPSIFGWLAPADAIYRALVFLVFSCPCALVISVPMAFFGGIGAGARSGILFKGGNVMSPLATADAFAFDKTGTLTVGEFEISDTVTLGTSKEELLELAATAEYGSNHPLALCIKKTVGKIYAPDSFKELSGRGVIAQIGDSSIAVGNKALLLDEGIEVTLTVKAKTLLYVARDKELLGVIGFADKIKPEAKEAIGSLKRLGVKHTLMLTGDLEDGAVGVANEIGIDELHASLMPADKYAIVEKCIKDGSKLAYVGDGINDSPTIARADVGIAMGKGGADISIEAADLVIMNDNLNSLPKAVKIARKTLAIAKENIIFSLSVKALVLILGALGYAQMWLAVFADVGVAMLAILNAMRALTLKNDN
ncbi:MAG: cadmium-translocating P-type ATPase [Clostridia bacterium]|nr:cadmium-translocating P-type ATPase [Clostridia bacterium]